MLKQCDEKQYAEKVYEVLESLRNNGPSIPILGICSNFDREVRMGLSGGREAYLQDTFLYHIEKMYKAWPHWSGCLRYPIGNDVGNGARLYINVYGMRDKWDRDTEYGRLRWDLLDHLIGYFKELDL